MRTRHAIRQILTLASALLSAATLSGQALPFARLSSDESRVLLAGNPVVRSLGSYRDLSLSSGDARGDELVAAMGKLKPNYLAELMLSVPARESLLPSLEAALLDFGSYPGIRYWSERQQTHYDLFDYVKVLSDTSSGGKRRIRILVAMEPFDDYEATIELERTPSSIAFRYVSDGPLVYTYRNFKAAGPGDLVWALYAFQRDGRLHCYAAGGVKAFDLFGAFRDRLESSLVGRVKSYFGYMFDRTIAPSR
ncbi:MAG: hypothetical protein JXA15_09500 [Spirochaetales bacterium]|nr:hypothetical protein [Spirochaetales bacterium]